METIFVFAVGDCDWVAARNEAEAEQCLRKLYDDETDEAYSQVVKLTDEQMEKFNFTDGEGGRISSFKERLGGLISCGEGFPQHFACNDF